MSTENIFSQDEVVLAPFNYLVINSGKGMRQKLIKAFNLWLSIPAEKLDVLTEVIEMLHNASLIVDDIEDGSDRRRGKPSAHMIFGVPRSINAANYAYFLALEKLLTLDHPDVPKIYTEQMLQLHRGQGMDIFWRCTFTCPSEEEYKDMVVKKTGGLFGMAVRLMQLFSSNTSNFKSLLNSLGLWFQIRDDYANLIDHSYHESKDFAEDLTEGKFSFPIVHAIRTFPHDGQVASILQQHTSDLAVKEYCVQHLAELGSFNYTVQTLIKLENECRRLSDKLGGNAYLNRLFDEYSRMYRLPNGEPKPYIKLSPPHSENSQLQSRDSQTSLCDN